jgi:hypothetical protein
VAIVGIVVFSYLYLNRKDTSDNAGGSSPIAGESKIVLERIYESPQVLSSQTITAGSGTIVGTPTGQSTVQTSPITKATTTPGIFDYTNKKKEQNEEEIKATINRILEQTKGKDSCELANISDSWSNPVEKTVCGLIKFTEKNIILPMIELSCYIYAGAMNINYDTDINVKYENDQCIIEDR